VFLPEMTERNLTLDPAQIKLKGSSEFLENVRALSQDYKEKTQQQLEKEQLAENLRLLYVAITRAKRYLCFSVSEKDSYGKAQEPSVIFEELLADE